MHINCTLKPGPEPSHTELLGEASMQIVRDQGVLVTDPAVDHDIAPGVQPDMTAHGFARDDGPAIQRQVLEAESLALCDLAR